MRFHKILTVAVLVAATVASSAEAQFKIKPQRVPRIPTPSIPGLPGGGGGNPGSIDLPTVDFPSVKLPTLDLPEIKLDPVKIDWSKVEKLDPLTIDWAKVAPVKLLTQIDIAKIDWDKLDLGRFDLKKLDPNIDVSKLDPTIVALAVDPSGKLADLLRHASQQRHANIPGWDIEDFVPSDLKEKWDRLVKEFTVEFWAYKPFPNATTGVKGEFFGYGNYEIGLRNATTFDVAVFVISLAAGPAGSTAYLYGDFADWGACGVWEAGEYIVKKIVQP